MAAKKGPIYLAVMPGRRKPLAVPKTSADFYRREAKYFYEVEGMTAAKAREAIKHGFVTPTWVKGEPVSGAAMAGSPFIPDPDYERLKYAWMNQSEGAFWKMVKGIAQLDPATPNRIGWEPLLKAIKKITGSPYTEEDVRLLFRGPSGGSLPVHGRRGPMGETLTDLHRSPHITWGTTAPYAWSGDARFRRVGFADIPYVVVEVYAKREDLGGLIPMARQKAMGLADVQGFSLAFRPDVYTGRTAMFQDQEGKRRRGKLMELRFEVLGGNIPRR